MHKVIIWGEVPRSAENLESLIITALVHEPTRREWHEQDSNTQNNGRNKLKRNWDAPRSLTLSSSHATNVVGSVVDPEGNHDTEGDCELLQSH